MATAKINISKMFSSIEPSYVSGSQAELGPAVSQITWRNAITIARKSGSWLVGSRSEAEDAIREWAANTGAWDEAEMEAWSSTEALALLVQNVAHDMRMIGSDDLSLEECVERYESTDWDKESEYPTLGIYMCKKDVCGYWYGGA